MKIVEVNGDVWRQAASARGTQSHVALCQSLDGVVHGVGDLFQRRLRGAKRGHRIEDGAQRPQQHPFSRHDDRNCRPTGAR